MKNKIRLRKLNRTGAHRTAMFRNMVTSLVKYERVKTTLPKAKALRHFADRVVTWAKRGAGRVRGFALARGCDCFRMLLMAARARARTTASTASQVALHAFAQGSASIAPRHSASFVTRRR